MKYAAALTEGKKKKKTKLSVREEKKSELLTWVTLQTDLPGVSFSKVSSRGMEDGLIFHHFHNTFGV